MMLSQYRDALKDAKKCIELDPRFVKVLIELDDASFAELSWWLRFLVFDSQAYTRFIKCSLMLGEVVEAEAAIGKLEQLEPSLQSIVPELKDLAHLKRFMQEAEVAYAAKDYRKVWVRFFFCDSL